MSVSENEKAILEKINESELITLAELCSFFQEENKNSSKNLVKTISDRLADRGLVTKIRPLGSTSLVITGKGKEIINGN